LTFPVLFQGASGAQQYVLRLQSGEFGNYLQDFFDGRWTAENPSSTKPRVYNREDQYWAANRIHFIALSSTDYIRAEEFEDGIYLASESYCPKLGLNTLRFYISGMNCITWDNFNVYDPEIDSSSTSSNYPTRRLFNLGS
jgi:TonB-dependent starch-binding outer membrane protein SusC